MPYSVEAWNLKSTDWAIHQPQTSALLSSNICCSMAVHLAECSTKFACKSWRTKLLLLTEMQSRAFRDVLCKHGCRN